MNLLRTSATASATVGSNVTPGVFSSGSICLTISTPFSSTSTSAPSATALIACSYV